MFSSRNIPSTRNLAITPQLSHHQKDLKESQSNKIGSKENKQIKVEEK